MSKYLYLIGSLVFALGLNSCKKHDPQTSAEIHTPEKVIPLAITRQQWTAETVEPGDKGENTRVRYSFNPDGTFAMTYEVPSAEPASSEARALAVQIYHFSGTYSYNADSTLTIDRVSYVRLEGQVKEEQRKPLVDKLIKVLTKRSFRYDTQLLVLTLVDKLEDSSSPEPMPSVFRKPMSPTEDKPSVPADPQANRSIPRELLDARWVLDISDRYNGASYGSNGRDFIGFEFNEDNTYVVHKSDAEFGPKKGDKQVISYIQDFYMKGTYRFSGDTIYFLSASLDHYGVDNPYTFDSERLEDLRDNLVKARLLFDAKQMKLHSLDREYPTDTAASLVKAPREFSLTSGSWAFDLLTPNKKDRVTLTDGSGRNRFIDGGQRTFTFHLDGTYTFHHLFESFDEHKDNLDRAYNDAYTIRGRYRYQDGKVTLLSSQFVGYDKRFASVRPTISKAEYNEELTGLVLLVDERRRIMRISISDSYGKARQSLIGETQEEQPYYLQYFGGESF